jgi:hypothetical protein
VNNHSRRPFNAVYKPRVDPEDIEVSCAGSGEALTRGVGLVEGAVTGAVTVVVVSEVIVGGTEVTEAAGATEVLGVPPIEFSFDGIYCVLNNDEFNLCHDMAS